MNPLENYPGVRKALYMIQWIANGITGALGIYFVTRDEAVPEGFVVTFAVLAFVWTYAGITASANVPDTEQLH